MAQNPIPSRHEDPAAVRPAAAVRTEPVIRAVGHLTTRWLAAVALLISGCQSQMTGPSAIDPDAPTEFTETASGLKYRILRKSNGTRPRPSDRVTVDYTGWLDDGSVFDSSYDKDKALNMPLSNMVDGFTEGVMLIGEGGMIELEIPPELAYGEAGKGSTIPPNSTLHFKVELIAVR